MYIGKAIKLRGVELADLDAVMKNFNTYIMRRTLNTPAVPYSREDEKEWIKSTWEAREKGTAYTFGIEILETEEFIGTTSLMKVSQVNRSAELGITIHDAKYWGHGYGSEAIQLLLSVGFDILGLHSVYLRVYDFNTRAIKLYEKCGFKAAGTRREAVFQEGSYHDVHFFDMLVQEYRELIEDQPHWPTVKDMGAISHR